MNPSDLQTGLTFFTSNIGASNQVGDVARALIQAGYAVGDISQIIDAAQNGGLMPGQQAQRAQAELAWLQHNAQQDSQQKGILLIGAVLVIGYLALRD